ncbi:Uncharacterized protein GBIM_05556 [Gryllus bimaculatus]|nr:Uncharacterized protein GBIM_05556 [Gryllus bimaculatus]
MIRGGVEYNLGIFITGVDKDSVADRAGLMIGDQILEVNGQSFQDVTHDEAVGQLKFHKRMALVVCDVGKVPHSCTAYDELAWDSPAHSPCGELGFCIKLRKCINLKNEFFWNIMYHCFNIIYINFFICKQLYFYVTE